MSRRACLGCYCVATLFLPAPIAAQTILGRVLDSVNEAPVGGAVVSLVTRAGEERVRTLTDTLGVFVLRPPEMGEYVLIAQRFGYLETRSPLIAFALDGEAPVDLVMSPEPIGLEGLEIEVEEIAAEQLTIMGLNPAVLGNRWIGRARIEAIPVKMDMGVILERTAQAGIRVIRPQNLTPGSDDIGLCVALYRARRMGQGRCALIVLNGIPIGGLQALNIDPESIETMAVLGPLDGSVQYGTAGGAGAVLVWTRHGR